MAKMMVRAVAIIALCWVALVAFGPLVSAPGV